MSTELDLDIATLVGEMEAVPCDLPQHGNHPMHTEEPASHYVRSHCQACDDDTGTIAACPGFVAAVRANFYGYCRICRAQHRALDMVTILGPVKS
ncbi:hypothetical protein E5206_09565 [Arthrobacter sp. PAMC25564]|uniref:hypothetical protein n=1 Tax=Arthrobacter sp. PAMC25564 TaxID=2565366 RepID=UPI0010A256F4|nr:hypothetical protein [Arthrobacter sp. PAMC25564]QCB97150.1 hypothetical protein E5206_09565 [Arthrobacter sp. PAMC25564]